MNELDTLKAMGLELPSPAYIFGTILFGLIGIGAFRYGRKNERPRTFWLGVVLMFYPYLISRVALLYAVGIVLCVGIYLDHQRP